MWILRTYEILITVKNPGGGFYFWIHFVSEVKIDRTFYTGDVTGLRSSVVRALVL